MYVIKRDGRQEKVSFDKITSRIAKLCYGLNADFIEPLIITQKVVQGVYPGVTTSELDTLAAETAAYMSTQHPDFSVLAARLYVSTTRSMSSLWIPTETRMIICWGRSTILSFIFSK